MTRLPQLRDALVDAAERQIRPARARRSLHAWWIGASLSLAVAGTAGAVAIVTGTVGGTPSRTYPEKDEYGNRFPAAPVVIATGDISNGRIEVVAYRMRAPYGGKSLLCVDVGIVGEGSGGSCNPGLPRRAAGSTGTGSVDEPGPTLAPGATTASVARIKVTFTHKGDIRSRDATLHPVRQDIAKRLKVQPFTYYTAELPPRARPRRASAYDRAGTRIWRAEFR